MHATQAAALMAGLLLVACGEEKANDTAIEPEVEEVDGAIVYAGNCSGCHGANGEGAASNPSLIESVPLMDDEALMDVLINPPGTMAIVSLTTAEADAVFVYLRDQFGEYGGAR